MHGQGRGVALVGLLALGGCGDGDGRPSGPGHRGGDGSVITVRAAGVPSLAGAAPRIVIKVLGEVVFSDTVDGHAAPNGGAATFDELHYQHTHAVAPQDVSVTFVPTSPDQSVRIASYSVDDQDVDVDGTGVWTTGFGDDCETGFRHDEWLTCHAEVRLRAGAVPPTQSLGVPIVVFAAGLDGAPNLRLRVNDRVVAEWAHLHGNIDRRMFQRFTYVHPGEATVRDVSLEAWTDPDNAGAKLQVDRIIVDGRPQEVEAAGARFTSPACGAQTLNSEVLPCSGALSFAATPIPADSGSTIVVRAAGRRAPGNVKPKLELVVNDEVVLRRNVRARARTDSTPSEDVSFQTFTYHHPTTVDVSDVVVRFANAEVHENLDLRVDRIEVDDVPYEAEHPFTVSTGTWADGSCEPGRKASEWLHCAGELRFAQGAPLRTLANRAGFSVAVSGGPQEGVLPVLSREFDQMTSDWQLTWKNRFPCCNWTNSATETYDGDELRCGSDTFQPWRGFLWSLNNHATKTAMPGQKLLMHALLFDADWNIPMPWLNDGPGCEPGDDMLQGIEDFEDPWPDGTDGLSNFEVALRTFIFETVQTQQTGEQNAEVVAWNVVNEAIEFPPYAADIATSLPACEAGMTCETGACWSEHYAVPLKCDTFVREMGEAYIEQAFRWTREALDAVGADARLQYADGPFGHNPSTEPEWAQFDTYRNNLVAQLVADDVPIDGVSMHGHVTLTPAGNKWGKEGDHAYTRKQMRELGALGLQVSINELDVWTIDQAFGADTAAVDAAHARQPEIFFELARACACEPACSHLGFWGASDAFSWRTDPPNATMLDENLQPKDAYFAVQQAFADPQCESAVPQCEGVGTFTEAHAAVVAKEAYDRLIGDDETVMAEVLALKIGDPSGDRRSVEMLFEVADISSPEDGLTLASAEFVFRWRDDGWRFSSITTGGSSRIPETCADGAKNNDETATDCGGSCGSCSTLTEAEAAVLVKQYYDHRGAFEGQYVLGSIESLQLEAQPDGTFVAQVLYGFARPNAPREVLNFDSRAFKLVPAGRSYRAIEDEGFASGALPLACVR